MSASTQRRRDPQPMTQGWEVAVLVVGLALIGLTLAALAGLGIAAALFGGGWVWPHGTNTIAGTLAGLLHGHPGLGLAPAQAARAAGGWPTYVCVGVCELMLIAASVAAGVAIARRTHNDGMATRRDAEQILGLGELRSARSIIRPDLYGRTEHSSRRRVSGWGTKEQT